jgi:hypothetical protein
VFQEFQKQARTLLPSPNEPNAYNQQQQQKYLHHPQQSTVSANTASTFQNNNYQGPTRGMNSVSMKMLNQGIQDAEVAQAAPPSVFDLKRGSNPTGATVPRGFKSVQAPQLLPPEQRHAPMRKEFEVQHVKTSWIEPKFVFDSNLIPHFLSTNHISRFSRFN